MKIPQKYKKKLAKAKAKAEREEARKEEVRQREEGRQKTGQETNPESVKPPPDGRHEAPWHVRDTRAQLGPGRVSGPFRHR